MWMRGLTVPSANLQMTPNWWGVLICWMLGRFCRVIWTGWINRLRPMASGSTTTSALVSQQPQAVLQAGEEWLESCLVEEDLGDLVNSWLDMNQCAPRWPKRTVVIWFILSWPAARGKWLSLCTPCWGHISSTVPCSGHLNSRTTLRCWSMSSEG